MCGIAGIVRLGPDAPPPVVAEALSMAERVRHRGPDGTSSWASPSGRCVLGHARLKVIDLDTGDQPMPNEDGSVQVVFNGEIYNFRELRAELERAGHRFRSKSDTEVLAHGWEEWGEALPERLDGMFAFGIWDESRGVLFLARDRGGKKPLYWSRSGGLFAFGSEVGALSALSWVDDEIDPRAFPYYLTFGYVPQPRTFYRGIRVLPPASWMWVGAGMGGSAGTGPPGGKMPEAAGDPMVPREYWRPRWSSDADLTDEEAKRTLRSLLGDAVERRLLADVPLGAFLSGGVDSSIVVGLMRERAEGPIRTFSLGFADDATYDETGFARLVSRRFGTEHTEFTVEAEHGEELLDALVTAHGQPFADSSAIPTWLVSRLTREHVTVALTGDGGDDVFAGYARFRALHASTKIPRWMAAFGHALSGFLPHHPDFRHPTRRLRQLLGGARLPASERLTAWLGYAALPSSRLVRSDRVPAVSHETLWESVHAPWTEAEGGSPLARGLSVTFRTYLPEDLLVKADRSSMAHGLELRSPFLDTRVVEFAAGLPDRCRLRGGAAKWLVKEAFADLLPPEVVHRPKMGFGVPLPVWFRTHWKGLFEDRLFGPGGRSWAWLRREPVERLWEEHQSGRADHGHTLWALLTLETWLRSRAP